ncbi:uncharacterized protein TM35_000271350 [Trypanosoma theileri]|uniref:Tbingi protein n=1 Tax=Trypanosoma theileri TaxID=67003 RepID=A0A1X0NPB6_9TRYP|nr:uncharacterized protein TM35_000271350 [Trypanosoma theileri]ORC86545.1 hypothetical protein TM35_000271350 [Trypanosoma theileri]
MGLRDTSPAESGDSDRFPCGAFRKFYAHPASLATRRGKFHEGEGMLRKRRSQPIPAQTGKNKRPSGISLPRMRLTQCVGKLGKLCAECHGTDITPRARTTANAPNTKKQLCIAWVASSFIHCG